MVRGIEGFEAKRIVYCCESGLPLVTTACELEGRDAPLAAAEGNCEPPKNAGGGILACA